MCNNDGPSGSLCREMVMGMEGLRNFMRGSTSRQNFLLMMRISWPFLDVLLVVHASTQVNCLVKEVSAAYNRLSCSFHGGKKMAHRVRTSLPDVHHPT